MDTLLDHCLHLTPKDDKTNVCIDFTVGREYEALQFFCSYSPKELENREEARRIIEEVMPQYVPEEALPRFPWEGFLPLVNLITLSVDWEGQYLGCAHRHAPRQEHRISESFASPGFFRHRAQPGDWRAVINVHALICPQVTYHLQVMGLERGEVQ